MSLAKQMGLPQNVQTPCVGLPMDVDLDDIHPWAVPLDAAVELVEKSKAPAFLYFIDNAAALKAVREDLKLAYKNGIAFWVCFPRTPRTDSDLTYDRAIKQMKKVGAKVRAEQSIDESWFSILFSKRKAK